MNDTNDRLFSFSGDEIVGVSGGVEVKRPTKSADSLDYLAA